MLIEIIIESWLALKRNYTRTLLTMLGIVWGIATVTLLIAYGSSFRRILVGGFDAFGKSVVICWPQQTSEQPGGQRAGKKVVFVAFNGKAMIRDVQVLSQRSGGLLVQGLNGGEDVITSPPQDLKDGDKIKIKGQS